MQRPDIEGMREKGRVGSGNSYGPEFAILLDYIEHLEARVAELEAEVQRRDDADNADYLDNLEHTEH